MRYAALLRGINVGGNNKVDMKTLRSCFEDAGFEEVSTYINSGNVLFASSTVDRAGLARACGQAIEQAGGFPISFCVISRDELQSALEGAPAWWDRDEDARHNVLFAIPPKSAEDILAEIGETKPEYERVACSGPLIFWTAPRATFSRTRFSKIVGSKAYRAVTIRNAATVKKISALL